MSLETGQGNNYRVEISGWDTRDSFFVEQATLDWDQDTTKRVSLRSSVREGSVVFLRLLQPFGDGTSLPVACRAVKVGGRGADASVLVELVQLHPRSSVEGSAHAGEALAFRIA